MWRLLINLNPNVNCEVRPFGNPNVKKEINISTIKTSLVLKIKSYAELMKLRLSSLVVLSAMLGYFLAPGVINNNEVLLCQDHEVYETYERTVPRRVC